MGVKPAGYTTGGTGWDADQRAMRNGTLLVANRLANLEVRPWYSGIEKDKDHVEV